MEKVIGGILGLAAFAAVLAAGLSKGSSFGPAALRAALALVLGYAVGRWLFGPAGLAIVKEAAGPVPPPAPPAGNVESKPAGAAPGQAPPSKGA
jgi:hypothetical protein